MPLSAARRIIYPYYEVWQVQILVDALRDTEARECGSLDPSVYMCDA